MVCLRSDSGTNRFGDPVLSAGAQQISSENLTEILVPVMTLGVFFLLFTLVPKLIFPTVDVLESTEAVGQVTGSTQNRGLYTQRLNRSSRISYDFNACQAMEPLPAGISPKDVNVFKLGHFLRTGDEVEKLGSSPVIAVHRGNETTRW